MQKRYILLTAAKNEEACIAEVIQLVVRQTVKPVAWFIMDDGSSDRTAMIVKSFAGKYPFINLQSAEACGGRNFGSQYKAVMAAYDLARTQAFDFVAVQDADQGPEREDYYELILQEFRRNPRLGMASGCLYERWRSNWECRQSNSDDAVTGGTAMFRRTAFDEIGGYTPLYYGGSDTLAQFELERAGWEILTRPDLHIYHYRPTCSAGGYGGDCFEPDLKTPHSVSSGFRTRQMLATAVLPADIWQHSPVVRLFIVESFRAKGLGGYQDARIYTEKANAEAAPVGVAHWEPVEPVVQRNSSNTERLTKWNSSYKTPPTLMGWHSPCCW